MKDQENVATKRIRQYSETKGNQKQLQTWQPKRPWEIKELKNQRELDNHFDLETKR